MTDRDKIARLEAELAEANKKLATWNPHRPFKILTDRNHLDPRIVRYPMPKPMWDAYQALLWSQATDGNLDRPTISRAVPTLLDARNPQREDAWGLFEPDWFQRMPLDGGDLRYEWIFNPALVRQWRFFVPPRFDEQGKQTAGSTYNIFLDVDTPGREIHILPTMSQTNFFTIGNKRLRISNQSTNLAGLLAVHYPIGKEGYVHLNSLLSLGDNAVEQRDGHKFLKVAHRGKTYGVKLEPLD